jgi:hypothetical protein
MGTLSDKADPMPLNGQPTRQVGSAPSGEHPGRSTRTELQAKHEDRSVLIRNFYQIDGRIIARVGLAKPLNIFIWNVYDDD